MPGLTDEAIASLANAKENLRSALEISEGGTDAERQTLTVGAVVSALEALCHEVASLRDANYAKLADIEGTLYSRLRG